MLIVDIKTGSDFGMYDILQANAYGKLYETESKNSSDYKINFFEKEHKYIINGIHIPSVTTVLNCLIPDAAKKLDAAKMGSRIHKLWNYMDMGILDGKKIRENEKGFLQAWKKFNEKYKLKNTSKIIEKRLFSEKHQFCGTIDYQYPEIFDHIEVWDVYISEDGNFSEKIRYNQSSSDKAFNYFLCFLSVWNIQNNRVKLK